MARERKGSIVKRGDSLYARLRFKDEKGKKRDIWRKAENRTHARQLIRQLLTEVEEASAATLDAANMTFAELALYFGANYLKPAEYVEGRKVAGVRSLIPARVAVDALKGYFGTRRLRSITYGDISAYRDARLKTPTRHGGQRAIATVNRELDKLRRMFNIAVQQSWLKENPFHRGNSLISNADETRRERVLSREEESRLFVAIEEEPLREHLGGILKIALDCALRRGEILTLLWSDVDFTRRTLTVRAFNSKTARSRTVAMTTRVYEDLMRRWEASGADSSMRVFGVEYVRRSFQNACRRAGVKDFRLHDCRHTAITRMIRAGIPPVEVMRVSGHTTMSAFYRYANLESDAIYRAASAIEAFHAEEKAPEMPQDAPHLVS